MKASRGAMVAATLGAAASGACSLLLGLDPPPTPDAGTVPDATMEGDGPDAGSDGKVDGAANPVCSPLDAGDGTTYHPLDQVAVDDAGTPTWDFFNTGALGKGTLGFAGAAFDGHYIYLAGRKGGVVRYDTEGAGFGAVSAWSFFNAAALPLAATGFLGAVFDGRYVYFVPGVQAGGGGGPVSVTARFDTQGTFGAAASWASFDLSALAGDGGAPTSGFAGGAFDGRYLYFVPHNDGSPDGRVVRYDTVPVDGGPSIDAGAGDAGDAGDAATPGGGFADAWSTFDLSVGNPPVNPAATGFYGAVFDGVSLYLVPQFNDAFNGAVHNGSSGIAARFEVDAAFTAFGSWATFDLTTVNGIAGNFLGGAFDGRYVYFSPHGAGVAMRFDPASQAFTSASSWLAYDVTRAVAPDAGSPSYSAPTFDGRFVYFPPSGPTFDTLLRYDTSSTFTADCAWSTVDLDAIDGGPQTYTGSVFDGQYVYLVSDGTGLIARFNAKTPPSTLPTGFHGSFF